MSTISYQYGWAVCPNSPREEFRVLAVFESDREAEQWRTTLPNPESYEVRDVPLVRLGAGIDMPGERAEEYALRGRRERATVRQWLAGRSA